MTHHIIRRASEAEWSPAEKVWAGISIYPARKTTVRGHVIAFAVGILVASVVVLIERATS